MREKSLKQSGSVEIESKKNHPLEYFVTDGFRSKLSERIIDLNLLQLPFMIIAYTVIYTITDTDPDIGL